MPAMVWKIDVAQGTQDRSAQRAHPMYKVFYGVRNDADLVPATEKNAAVGSVDKAQDSPIAVPEKEGFARSGCPRGRADLGAHGPGAGEKVARGLCRRASPPLLTAQSENAHRQKWRS